MPPLAPAGAPSPAPALALVAVLLLAHLRRLVLAVLLFLLLLLLLLFFIFIFVTRLLVGPRLLLESASACRGGRTGTFLAAVTSLTLTNRRLGAPSLCVRLPDEVPASALHLLANLRARFATCFQSSALGPASLNLFCIFSAM